jgi:hypothetical protein
LRHHFAAACEARKLVLELRELDLKLAFAGASVASEDVEDELCAVDDATWETRLEVAKLRGRQVVIEEDEVGLGGACDGVDLVELAGADEGCGIGARAMLHEDGSDLGFGRAGELLKLGEGEIELEIAWERRLGRLRQGFATGCAVECRGGTGLAGRRRKAGPSAREVDGYEDGAFTRCTAAPSPGGNGLGTC